MARLFGTPAVTREADIRHWDDIGYSVVLEAEAEYADTHTSFKIYKITGQNLTTPTETFPRCYEKPGGNSMDVTGHLSEAEVFLSGGVKWDGCSNWNFDAQEDCMLHFCTKESAMHIGTIFQRLYEWAKELGMDRLLMPYTAQQVRALVSDCKYFEDVNGRLEMDPIEAALTAYADRLEQDEQRHLVYNLSRTPAIVNLSTPEVLDLGREEGRREAYREIAATPPWRQEYSWHAARVEVCRFCDCETERWEDGIHKPDCLYLRATAALRETTPTP